MSAKNCPADKITEEDYICEACFNLLMETVNAQMVNDNGQDQRAGPSRRGHTQVCLVCGRSLVNRRSHIILRHNLTDQDQQMIQVMESRIAPRQINLKLILVSGKTKEFIFSPVDSAGDIAIHVYDNWPEADWSSECVSRAEILRLIYQGRFLHSSVTLGALGLPLGRTTVMHLVPREHLPEPNSHDQRQKSKGGTSSCCSASCCIL